MFHYVKTVSVISLNLLLAAVALQAQVDPGPRSGAAGAGGPLPGLDSYESAFFAQTLIRFQEVDSVSGTIESGSGLGPTFNGNSCAMCHAHPAVGGSSPAVNPQVALATLHGARNTVPSFIQINGPVREARFVSTNPGNAQAPLDGGVHGLFTISGRTDAPGCSLAQPDFAGQLAQNNVIFRIPTPTFGLGLVENTPDATLQANLATNAPLKAALGITGRFNMSGNDGTITRFGWKAQNKSLLIFAGEAYNVEQGVSNEIFPTERSAVAGCVFNAGPEDYTNIVVNGTTTTGTASAMSSDVVNFAALMQLMAPPTPVAASAVGGGTASAASLLNGQTLFNTVGCALCHSTSLTTAASIFTHQSNVTYHPYSDFALHSMGSNLADGISQGIAGPDEFRTAPLWGVGQRLFFLHDGRTSDLLQAIQAHFSPGDCTNTQASQQFRMSSHLFQPNTQTETCGSEANLVIAAFNALSVSQKQDILNFLRSL